SYRQCSPELSRLHFAPSGLPLLSHQTIAQESGTQFVSTVMSGEVSTILLFHCSESFPRGCLNGIVLQAPRLCSRATLICLTQTSWFALAPRKTSTLTSATQ